MSVLAPVLIINQIEGSWFSERQGALLNQAGCWARFLRFLMSTLPNSGRGNVCGIDWQINTSPQSWFGRTGRWIEITHQEERIKVSVEPQRYGDSVDYRFMVECTTLAIAPIVLLFTDAILEQG